MDFDPERQGQVTKLRSGGVINVDVSPSKGVWVTTAPLKSLFPSAHPPNEVHQSPRRYFNRSICYCVTRITGVSLSVVNCITHLLARPLHCLPSPVLAFLGPPMVVCMCVCLCKIQWYNATSVFFMRV